MFGYNVLAIIERNGVVGIITGWTRGHMGQCYARVMFEDGKFGVDFCEYPLSAVARFRVIG